MDALLHSLGLVCLSEMGDKTQLLALVLATRFRRPWAVMTGILLATLLNHACAAYLGQWASSRISGEILRWGLATLFLAFAIWLLIPDQLDDETAASGRREATPHTLVSTIWTTAMMFFIAEMGDKTQLSTVALGARFDNVLYTTLGTTLGMLVADGLAVFWGPDLTRVVPMVWIRRVASLAFIMSGVGILLWGQ